MKCTQDPEPAAPAEAQRYEGHHCPKNQILLCLVKASKSPEKRQCCVWAGAEEYRGKERTKTTSKTVQATFSYPAMSVACDSPTVPEADTIHQHLRIKQTALRKSPGKISRSLRPCRSSGRHSMAGGKPPHARSLCNELSSSRQSGAGKSVPKVPNSQTDLCRPDPTGYLMQQQYLEPKPGANRQSSYILEYLMQCAESVLHMSSHSYVLVASRRRGIKVIRNGGCSSPPNKSPVYAKRIA